MKVVHLSTSVSRASANFRLHHALLAQGVESSILVQGKSLEEETIYYAKKDIKRKLQDKTRGRFFRLFLRRWDKLPADIPFSHGQTGTDVSNYPLIQQADIIHLHWVCNYLSIGTIRKLIATGKPIVWTCHDSWPFTGGCHVWLWRDCKRYAGECGKCPLLPHQRKIDITKYVYMSKKKHWRKNQITFIAPSNWMKNNINQSSLFSKNRCEVIPNTINLEIFSPLSEEEIQRRCEYKKEKGKMHLLFGAESVNTPYKGFQYLLEILEKLLEKEPEFARNTVLHIIGEGENKAPVLQSYECHYWGFIRDEQKMAAIYNIADVYVYPSIDDNLPNMIMESLACGTPVAAFDTGGITDLVEHKQSGYIAEYKNAGQLMEGILWIARNNPQNCLGKNGRNKAEKEYNPERIAREHIRLYESLLEENTL